MREKRFQTTELEPGHTARSLLWSGETHRGFLSRVTLVEDPEDWRPVLQQKQYRRGATRAELQVEGSEGLAEVIEELWGGTSLFDVWYDIDQAESLGIELDRLEGWRMRERVVPIHLPAYLGKFSGKNDFVTLIFARSACDEIAGEDVYLRRLLELS